MNTDHGDIGIGGSDVENVYADLRAVLIVDQQDPRPLPK